MIPFQSYYGLGSCSSRDGYSSHSLLGSMDMINGGGSTNISNSSTAEKKAISASKSHSEAEKRRRERINGHLRTLRTLLPNTIKTDKASLLAEVVHQVRELKKLAADVANKDGNGCSSSSRGSSTTRSRGIGSGSGSREWIFPGESDELIMSYCESEERSESSSWSRVRVSISCEDRVDLVKDLSDAVKSVRARVVKAEMSTIGGRTKSELVIEKRKGEEDDSELCVLRRALKSVIDKPTVSGTNQILFGNKRQRLSLSHQFC